MEKRKMGKSIELLKQAHNLNKATPFIALRYAKVLENKGLIEDAKKVLKDTLNLNAGDKDINFEYARLIEKFEPENESEIVHFYRRSFTKGDTRYEAQFCYARAQYMFNHVAEAKKVFDELSYIKISPDRKNKPRAFIKENCKLKQFKGTLVHKEMSYAFVRRDFIGDDIYIYRYSENKDWSKFKVGSRVVFNLGFNFKGPIAINSIPE